MRITYDPDANAALIKVVDGIGFGDVAKSDICDLEIEAGAITLAFDSAEKLVEVEVLGARNLLAPDVIDRATPPGETSQEHSLRLEYDSAADTAYIYLTNGILRSEVAVTYPCGAEIPVEINLDFDKESHLLGIEIIDASQVLSSELIQGGGQ